MKTKIIIAVLAITLAACKPLQTNTTDIQNTDIGIALTQTALPTATLPPSTFTPTALSISTPAATPIPTQPSVPIITPDAIQVEKWKEYQTELAKLVLSDSGADSPFYKMALCEWDILGRSDQKVYVWAMCSSPNSGDSRPAVIHLGTDGSIQKVEVPFHGDGWDPSIRRLFPVDVQEKIDLYIFYWSSSSGRVNELRSHLQYRETHIEELPLIVLSATPIP